MTASVTPMKSATGFWSVGRKTALGQKVMIAVENPGKVNTATKTLTVKILSCVIQDIVKRVSALLWQAFS